MYIDILTTATNYPENTNLIITFKYTYVKHKINT